MRLLLVTILAAVGISAAFGQAGGETRQYFKDWLAACRADGYCSATAYQNPAPGNGTVADYVLRVGRHAEGTYWELSLSTVAAMADPQAPFVVTVDQQSERFAGPQEVAAYGAVNDFYFLGTKAQAVMDRLAPGTEITTAFTDTDGNRQQAVFSLSGLTASLIWIDEQQRRLGSERVAEAPPVGLAPAGDRGVPAALLAQHAADSGCQPMSEIANGDDIEIGTVDASHGIYFLPCWSAAYNFGWKAYVEVFDGEYAVQALPEYSPTRGWTATTHLVNYGWDDTSKTISTFSKGRGLGDCGTWGSWTWTGFEFSLVEFAVKEACDDAEPGDFPIVYSRQHEAAN